MNKKMVFISQPMNGLSDEDILAARAEAIRDIFNILGEKGIEEYQIEIADSFFTDFSFEEVIKNVPLSYLAKSIGMLSISDYAYFCDGWDSARGCKAEHYCAKEYGIEIIKD